MCQAMCTPTFMLLHDADNQAQGTHWALLGWVEELGVGFSNPNIPDLQTQAPTPPSNIFQGESPRTKVGMAEQGAGKSLGSTREGPH